MTRRLSYALLLAWILLATGCTARIVGTFAGQPFEATIVFPVGSGGTTPTQTTQPTATLPATNTPTVTPSATAVQTEPATPTQAGTPVVTPGPTNTTVPATPEPTSIPAGKCWGTVNTAVLNVRSGPGTGYVVIGKVYRGDVLTFERYQVNTAGELWREIWWDITSTGEKTQGWVLSSLVALGEGAECGTAFGVIAVQNPNMGDVQQLGKTLEAAGIQPAVTIVLDCGWSDSLYDAGWFVLCRPYAQHHNGDCPDMALDARQSARVRVANVVSWAGNARYTMLQISNECGGWPSASYLATWIDEVITQCEARGIRCVPVMWATGHLELSWLPELTPVLHRMKENGMCWGRNLYPAENSTRLSEITPYTLWTTWRYRMDRIAVGLDNWPCLIVSEAGQEDAVGVDLADSAKFAGIIDGEARAVTFWVVSSLPYIQNFNGRAWELAQRIREQVK